MGKTNLENKITLTDKLKIGFIGLVGLVSVATGGYTLYKVYKLPAEPEISQTVKLMRYAVPSLLISSGATMLSLVSCFGYKKYKK